MTGVVAHPTDRFYLLLVDRIDGNLLLRHREWFSGTKVWFNVRRSAAADNLLKFIQFSRNLLWTSGLQGSALQDVPHTAWQVGHGQLHIHQNHRYVAMLEISSNLTRILISPCSRQNPWPEGVPSTAGHPIRVRECRGGGQCVRNCCHSHNSEATKIFQKQSFSWSPRAPTSDPAAATGCRRGARGLSIGGGGPGGCTATSSTKAEIKTLEEKDYCDPRILCATCSTARGRAGASRVHPPAECVPGSHS